MWVPVAESLRDCGRTVLSPPPLSSASSTDDDVARGWSTTTMPGGHLHMLVDPEAVAAELDRLVSELLDPVD